MLARTAGVLQGQSYRDIANKVHVADVDEHLGRVEREFAESKVDIVVRVRRIEDGGLNETGTRIDFEGQGSANGEPYSATCDPWDGCCDSVSGSSERNGNVGADSCTC